MPGDEWLTVRLEVLWIHSVLTHIDQNCDLERDALSNS